MFSQIVVAEGIVRAHCTYIENLDKLKVAIWLGPQWLLHWHGFMYKNLLGLLFIFIFPSPPWLYLSTFQPLTATGIPRVTVDINIVGGWDTSSCRG